MHFDDGSRLLLALLLGGIQAQIRLSVDAARIAAERGNERRREAALLQSELEAAARDMGRLKADKLRIYEKYKSGLLEKDAYLAGISQCENELEALRRKADGFEAQAAARRQAPPDFNIQPPCLTRQLADELIECVYIYDDAHIEIVWRWRDDISALPTSSALAISLNKLYNNYTYSTEIVDHSCEKGEGYKSETSDYN